MPMAQKLVPGSSKTIRISNEQEDNTSLLTYLGVALIGITLSLAFGLDRFLQHIYNIDTDTLGNAWHISYVGSLILLWSISPKLSKLHFCKSHILLFIIILAALLSLFWTIDQTSTIKRSYHLLGQLCVAISIGLWFRFESLVRCISIFLILFLSLSIASHFVFPNETLARHNGALVWVGFTDSKNNLGLYGAICALISVFYFHNSRDTYHYALAFIGLSLSILVVLKTDSATALVCLVISLSYYLIFNIGLTFRKTIAFLVVTSPIILFSIVLLLYFVEPSMSDFTSILNRSGTFTDRVPIWESSWEATQGKPWLGYGFGTIWHVSSDYAVALHRELIHFRHGEDIVPHAHNGFLSISNQLGLPVATVCVWLVVVKFLSSMKIFLKSTSSDHLAFASISIFVIFYNFTEDGLFRPHSLLWTLYLVLTVNLHSFLDTREQTHKNQREKSIRGKRKMHRRKKRRNKHKT